MKIKSKVQDFADNLKDNPRAIIKWAEKEIKLYEELIAVIKKEMARKK